MRNNGHCAVQGHSRSPILVPMESQWCAATAGVVPGVSEIPEIQIEGVWHPINFGLSCDL